MQSGLVRVSKNDIVRTYEAGDVKQPNEVQILAAEIGLSTKGYLIKIAGKNNTYLQLKFTLILWIYVYKFTGKSNAPLELKFAMMLRI